ncbi:MAG: hypothetical protein KDK53_03675 [Maritimibacter sp.]|nr:hypothetical protein [Maritimibacter sp.]
MRHLRVPLRTRLPARHLPVFRGRDFRVIEGVNDGDPLTDARELLHEDIYALTDRAEPVRLGLITGPGAGPMLVSSDSDAGTPGAAVFLDSLLTFMGPAGGPRETLVFVEVDAEGLIAEVYLHPLAPLTRKQGYTLITIDRDGAAARFAAIASVAVIPGTPIPFASGIQRPDETLCPGDPILTRGNAPQVLR